MDIEKCRICLINTTRKFDNNLFDSNDICNQIRLCTGVLITFLDNGPTKICSQCYAELNISHDFREKCQQSNEKLNQVISEVNDSKIIDFVKKEFCDYSSDTNADDVSNPVYGQNLTLPEYLKYDTGQGILESDKGDEEPDFVSKRIRRSLHSIKYKDEEKGYGAHFKININKSSKKNGWKKKSRRSREIIPSFENQIKKELNVGLSNRQAHKLTDKYQCDVCGIHFPKKRLLNQHIRTHYSDLKYSCEECNKSFAHKGNLRVHIRSHSEERPYHCDICSKKFSKKRNLFVHKLRHMKIKNHSCEKCGAYFYTNGELKTHMRKHTGEKPFTCTVCGKSFTAKNNLLTHLTSHTGEKPYSCDFCKKRFNSKNVLTNHKRIHTGEKPFVCSVCGKRFSVNKLAIHMRIHTGERPHSCSICNKTFRTTTALHIHKRLHTGEKPYECHLCLRLYGHTQSRNKHLRRKHGITNINKEEKVDTGDSTYRPPIVSPNSVENGKQNITEFEV